MSSIKSRKFFLIVKKTLSHIKLEKLANVLRKNLPTYKETFSNISNSRIVFQDLLNTSVTVSQRVTSSITKTKTPESSDEGQSLLVSHWKSEKIKPRVTSDIRHIIAAIEDSECESTLETRTEAFITYLHKNPEGRVISIKEGAVRSLLNARDKFKTKDQPSVREALSMLGFNDPVKGNGIRILSIDGGGVRGLIVLEILKKLEQLTGQRTYELFDLICGTSTGAILAFSIGVQHKTLDEIEEIYLDISNEIFTRSAFVGTGNLVWTQSYYSTSLWENKLREYLGDDILIKTSRDALCPKLCSVSAVVNQSLLSAYLFRNYSFPRKVRSEYLGGNEHKIWEAVRASAAAPTYFEEFKLGDFIHQDGGILVNNPTAIAIHEAKLLWPRQPIQCVVSCGTGRVIPCERKHKKDLPDPALSTSWKSKFYRILDSATDTEGVHTMLDDLLPDNVYYRFNPYLVEMVNMAEIDQKKLEQLKRDALMYLRRNEDKFIGAAEALMKPKTYVQKSIDWINTRRDIYGL